MDADRDEQDHRVIQIDVEGHAGGRTVAWCHLAAAVAGYSRQEVCQFANLAERGIDGQCEETESFLGRVVHSFYHAIAVPAGLQTSITQFRQ
jgi:hypothetical protein